ncbi:methionine adenosyltransferase [candidate division WWE3 bacterium]|uniref:Methionine adenosyltransferase n=1 Tax=candidate division WWE3 bacterium TaxID=2053526 RepID=A0A7X9E7P7_UNCKA|nr:methionine adenosyltransferase [candidate division WWE3 bacterium]
MLIQFVRKEFIEPVVEFVERKGLGHPDTLSDLLAEYLSVQYSLYTKQKFGAVLHHNFDKVGLLGGSSYVKFGEGHLVNPIRVLLNGRASTRFGDEIIPVKELLIDWSKSFLSKKLPEIDVAKDLEFHYNLSNTSSPGKTDLEVAKSGTRRYWFEPRNLGDVRELKQLVSNDTSLGVGFAPLSKLENFVLEIEHTLSSDDFRKSNPWIGSDIKIMGFKNQGNYYLTMCIPQISKYVKDISEYKNNQLYAENFIRSIAKKYSMQSLELNINTRDNFENGEIYLTAIGSSIESGDEGLVGRGNRINGLITPFRVMSMEGSCGKNPVYHIGKVYYLAANEIAKEIFENFKISNEVCIVSQSGRLLVDPWIVLVTVPQDFNNFSELEKLVKDEVSKVPNLTDGLLKEQFTLC